MMIPQGHLLKKIDKAIFFAFFILSSWAFFVKYSTPICLLSTGPTLDITKLVQKGINGNEYIVDIIDYCAANRKEAQVWQLLQDGLKIRAGNYPAFCACMRCEFTDCAQLLLKKGMDFDAFKQRAAEKKLDLSQNDTYAQLEAHWAEMQEPEQAPEE